MGIERRRPRGDGGAVDLDAVEAASEPDHHAANATVAHDQVGAHPHRKDRHRRVEGGEEIGKVVFIGGQKQPVRRATDPHPGEIGERLVGGQGAAHGGKIGAHAVWVASGARRSKSVRSACR